MTAIYILMICAGLAIIGTILDKNSNIHKIDSLKWRDYWDQYDGKMEEAMVYLVVIVFLSPIGIVLCIASNIATCKRRRNAIKRIKRKGWDS